MSLPQTLAEGVRDRIVRRFEMTEVPGVEGGPFLSLTSPMSPAPVGWVKVYAGGPLQKIVNVGLVVPQIGLDSHMVFAFTKTESPIPHFTVDSVKTGDSFAFHLDLIPRADLGANLAYMVATHKPLTPFFEAALAIEGLTPAKLQPLQLALMSPWMLANRANEAAFKAIEAPVGQYLEHWFGLVEKGLPAEIAQSLDEATLAKRDRDNRAALFNPETDPVWNHVDRLIGKETCVRIRDLLKSSGFRQ